MSCILPRPDRAVEPAAVRAWAEKRMVYVELTDGRIVGFPADRFKALKAATEEQLAKVTIEVDGYALRWNEIDEDITVPGVVAAHFPAPLPDTPVAAGYRPGLRPRKPANGWQ